VSRILGRALLLHRFASESIFFFCVRSLVFLCALSFPLLYFVGVKNTASSSDCEQAAAPCPVDFCAATCFAFLIPDLSLSTTEIIHGMLINSNDVRVIVLCSQYFSCSLFRVWIVFEL
jgi:hypothetical protein